MDKQPIFIDFYNLHLNCGFIFFQDDSFDLLKENVGKYWIKEGNEFHLKKIETQIDKYLIEDVQHILQIWKEHPNLNLDKIGEQFNVNLGALTEFDRRVIQNEKLDEEDIAYPFWSRKFGHTFAIQNIIPANRKDISKLINFFRERAPTVSSCLTKKEFTEKFTNTEGTVNGTMLSPDDNTLQATLGNLGAYEWRSQSNWFESKFFWDFMFDYCCFRQLVGSYINNQMPTWTLAWLQEQLKQYQKSFQIWKGSKLISHLTTRQDKISPKDYKFIESASAEKFMYALDLGEVLSKIYLEIMDLLKEKKDLRQCQAPQTQKTKKCQNIFAPQPKGKEHRYCSTKCSGRVRRRKYYRIKGE